MRKFNEQNERTKRQYLTFLKEAKGQDEASLDKVAAALLDFEEALGFKPFKAFHRDWAGRYKRHLEKRRNARTGKPLGLTTRDATLRLVKGFFHWLVSQPGFKSRISYADVDYFSNNAKDARAAHAQRPIPYPSIAQCAHAFRAMPEGDEVERRDKAIFAFLMLTGARDGAAASLRLKHVDLVEGSVFQDGREVRTKNGKSIETWFFPVDPMYRAAFEAWVRLSSRGAPLWAGRRPLSEGGGRGAGAPLHPARAVPRALRQRADHSSRSLGVPSPPWACRNTLRTASGRRSRCSGTSSAQTMEQRKAWSQNLGHEHLATTVSAYMPVSRERQGELLRLMQIPE